MTQDEKKSADMTSISGKKGRKTMPIEQCFQRELYTKKEPMSIPNSIIVADFIFGDHERAVNFGKYIFGTSATDVIPKMEEYACRQPVEYALRALRWMRNSRLMMNSFHKYEERRMGK